MARNVLEDASSVRRCSAAELHSYSSRKSRDGNTSFQEDPFVGDNPINAVFPYLRVRSAVAAIEFYKQAFGAVEDFRLTEPSGRIGHAELKFGSATLML